MKKNVSIINCHLTHQKLKARADPLIKLEKAIHNEEVFWKLVVGNLCATEAVVEETERRIAKIGQKSKCKGNRLIGLMSAA